MKLIGKIIRSFPFAIFGTPILHGFISIMCYQIDSAYPDIIPDPGLNGWGSVISYVGIMLVIGLVCDTIALCANEEMKRRERETDEDYDEVEP